MLSYDRIREGSQSLETMDEHGQDLEVRFRYLAHSIVKPCHQAVAKTFKDWGIH
jgi:hypothetical protein